LCLAASAKRHKIRDVGRASLLVMLLLTGLCGAAVEMPETRSAGFDVLPAPSHPGPAIPAVPPLPGRPPQTVPKMGPATELPPAAVVPPDLGRPAPESLGIP
jgi:hypothetical protein